MHLKQQDNLLINKDLIKSEPQKTFHERQDLVPYPFILYWVGNNKTDNKEKRWSNFAFWLVVQGMWLWWNTKHNFKTFFIIIMWFAMSFSLMLTWRKVKNMLALQFGRGLQ